MTTTDYSGGFIYENNTLQFFAHEEGRVRKSGASLVYDYYIKDHLGNTRMTLTEATDVTVYMATMETEYKSFEESLFLNLDASRVTSTSGNKTIDGSITANEASRLNGNVSSRRSGPGKLMAVTAGDEVDMEVYAKYDGSFGSSTALAQSAMVTAVAATFGGVSGGSTEQQSIYNLFNGNAGYFYVGGSGNSGEPRAYLNYILFDQDFNYLSGGFDQVSSAASEAHEKLSFNTVNITQGGYLYVFVSNESNTDFEVYFDDLRITHTKGAILQEDHYYPFGANISALSSTAPLSKPNKYKFNGNEEQTEFDLNLYDFNARQYDAVLGRFTSVDPLADHSSQFGQSPYQYAWNNPMLLNDPTGECPKCWEFVKGVGRGVASGFRGTVDFVTTDAWKAETWEATGNLALGLAVSGGTGAGLANTYAVDAALGTNTAGAVNALGESVQAGVDKVKNGDAGDIGEVVGEVIWAVAEGAVGSKGAGAITKGGKVAKVAGLADDLPSPKMGSSRVAKGFDEKVRSRL